MVKVLQGEIQETELDTLGVSVVLLLLELPLRISSFKSCSD